MQFEVWDFSFALGGCFFSLRSSLLWVLEEEHKDDEDQQRECCRIDPNLLPVGCCDIIDSRGVFLREFAEDLGADEHSESLCE